MNSLAVMTLKSYAENNAVYLEIWFDSEGTRQWRITKWFIDNVDFDPLSAEYETVDQLFSSSHQAIAFRRGLRQAYREQGYRVYTNEWNPDSMFTIVQSWLADLLNPKLKGRNDT